MSSRTTAGDSRPHVAVIGGGFCGLAAAYELGRRDVQVVELIEEAVPRLAEALCYTSWPRMLVLVDLLAATEPLPPVRTRQLRGCVLAVPGRGGALLSLTFQKFPIVP